MSRAPNLDLRLYLVTDPDLIGERSLLDVVGQATAGGVTLVQLRNKVAEARDLLALAEALKGLLEPKGVPLVVNDRVDVAAAAGVGCHIGQSDLPPAAARAILGEEAIIGLSLDRIEQTEGADPACLDYVAHGPFAATGTKADAGVPVGAEGIAAVRALTALPLVAIGGIDVTNAAHAIRCRRRRHRRGVCGHGGAGSESGGLASERRRRSNRERVAPSARTTGSRSMSDERPGATGKVANVLTIAGSDSGGGAGIQADLKAMSALGVYGLSVITALTAQNTRAVTAIHDAPPGMIAAQLDAVFDDIRIDAVKIGMLSRPEVIEVVADRLRRFGAKKDRPRSGDGREKR